MLSVILITPNDFETVRTTIRHLNAQTIAGHIQLILGAPSAAAVNVPEAAVERLGRCDVIEVGPIATVSDAKAALIPHALAPIVAFSEDHSFPAMDWAAELLEAHSRGYAAVCPTMVNANPRTLLSWCSLFLHFGSAVDAPRGEVRRGGASHNTSYLREALLSLGDDLPVLLQVELLLQDALHRRGYRLYHQPSARTRHVQATRLYGWLGQGYTGGRLFGALRADVERWPRSRRALMAAAFPLIPAVRLLRTVREIQGTRYGPELLPQVLPHLIAGLLVHAAGEVTGYLLGVGKADVKYSAFEMSRFRDTAVADRVAWS
jgi:hypothetical protein